MKIIYSEHHGEHACHIVTDKKKSWLDQIVYTGIGKTQKQAKRNAYKIKQRNEDVNEFDLRMGH